MQALFNRELKEELSLSIQDYLRGELDIELGNFEAEFLLDFISENIGPYYYNQAIGDMQQHLSVHLDTLSERMVELEKPLPGRR